MLKRFIFFILFASIAGTAMAQNGEEESILKAAFIYNFTRYIDWGTDTEENEFIIGIIGSSVIDNPITQLARTNTVKNKRISIRHFNRLEDISYCQILFIPQKCPFPLQSVLDKTGKGMLTISEEPGMARLGTAFNFILVNDKLKFEANLKAIYSAGLKAGSQLLKLAIIVD